MKSRAPAPSLPTTSPALVVGREGATTLAIACLGCSTSLLTTLSKRATSGSAYTYSPPAVIITAEQCTAVISLGLVVGMRVGMSAARAGKGQLLLPGVPRIHAPPPSLAWPFHVPPPCRPGRPQTTSCLWP